jgi:hypothetical protein
MTHVDSALLDLTEWGCRKFQLLTGRTNLWLAVQLTNVSIIVYFVWAAVFFQVAETWLRVALGLFCAGLFTLLTQTILKVPIEASESNAYRRVEKGFRNPRRIRDAALRLSFLTLSVLLFAPVLYLYVLDFRARLALLSYSLIALTTVVLYLLACDPLPPCRGKMHEWLRGAVPARPVAERRAARRIGGGAVTTKGCSAGPSRPPPRRVR